MAIPRFADFKSEMKISDGDFALLESQGNVRLSPEQRSTIEHALKVYEFFRALKEAGDGAALKEALRRLQRTTESFIESMQAVANEPGHILEFLLAESDADVSRLPYLLAKCNDLNQQVARPGRKKDFFLDSLLSRLAQIFLQAGGRGTSVSHGATGPGGPFLRFAFAATKLLPKKLQPHSEAALGARWNRIRQILRTEKVRAHMWIGGPHPASAKPWFNRTKF
jgi:hypothetical protein